MTRRSVGVEAIQAREQETVERGGHLRGRSLRGAMPRLTVAHQHARRDEGAHHFLEVERVASGPLEDEGSQMLGEEARRVAEPRGQEVFATGVRERHQLDPGVRGAAGVERIRIERRAIHEEDE